MKLILIPDELSNLDAYIDRGCEGIIIGLKDLSTNYEVELDVEQIKLLKEKYPTIDIFVSMNKNFFNEEMSKVEQSLIELDKLDINGILYYDLSVVYLKNKNNLNVDLVWNQTHMVTNYNTCNYYYDLGVKYGFLSTEITLDEINEIKEKTNMKLFAFGYGYPVMAHTRRSLLTNYFINRGKEYDGSVCHIYDNNNKFSLKEDETGTTFLNDEFVNGSCLLTNSNVDFVVFNNNLFPEDKSLQLVSLISEYKTTNNERIIGEIEDLIGDYTNFFYKKTIFMVKKNDK